MFNQSMKPTASRRNDFSVFATDSVFYLFLVKRMRVSGEHAMQEELLRLEREFAQAVVSNDATAVGRLLADDWIIVDPDGRIIDKSRFLEVIKSGALSHQKMESDDVRVRIYENTAIVTALTMSKGKFMGQDFTSVERATDIFVKQNDRWQCVFTHLTRSTSK
jgi:ketosteroid isomerase-like protein